MTKKKKLLVILGSIVGVLLVAAAVIVFFVLPTYFGSSEAELKAIENTNVDSLMNIEVPAEPVLCDTVAASDSL